MPTGQLKLDNLSLKLSSDMILDGVKMTVKTNYLTPPLTRLFGASNLSRSSPLTSMYLEEAVTSI